MHAHQWISETLDNVCRLHGCKIKEKRLTYKKTWKKCLNLSSFSCALSFSENCNEIFGIKNRTYSEESTLHKVPVRSFKYQTTLHLKGRTPVEIKQANLPPHGKERTWLCSLLQNDTEGGDKGQKLHLEVTKVWQFRGEELVTLTLHCLNSVERSRHFWHSASLFFPVRDFQSDWTWIALS